jgi:hypothetical protein
MTIYLNNEDFLNAARKAGMKVSSTKAELKLLNHLQELEINGLKERLKTAKELLEEAKPKFQSFEDCDDPDCSSYFDHEVREKIEKFLNE